MTLILASVKQSHTIVVADGAEFTHASEGPKQLAISNRRKIFPVPDRSVVLAVHGAAKIHSDQYPDGIPVSRLIEKQMTMLKSIDNVGEIAQFLFEELSPSVRTSFQILENSNITVGALKILIFAYDKRSPHASEILWQTPSEGGASENVRFHLKEKLTLFHGGSGEPVAKAVLTQKGGSHYLNTIQNAGVPHSVQLWKNFYRDALALTNSTTAPEFGGEYHCVSLTPNGWTWQSKPAEFAAE